MPKLILAKTLLVALAFAQAGDIVTTNSALATGNGIESNPVMGFAMTELGQFWWLPKAGLGLFLIYTAITAQAFTRRQIIILSLCFKVYALTLLSNVFHWL